MVFGSVSGGASNSMKRMRGSGENAQLTLKLTEALAQSVSAESFPRVMQVLCEELGWDLGEAWLSNEGRLQMSAAWHALSKSGDLWVSSSSAAAVHPGQGLVGRVWQSGEPEWIADIGGDDSFVRRPFAQAAGLTTACVFPFRAQGRVVGVGCLLCRECRMRDSRILDLLMTAGEQIGKVAQAYESTHRSERYLRDLTDSTNDILAVLAINGTIEYENSAAERVLGYQPRERIGRNVFDFIHPDDMPLSFDAFRAGMQEPGSVQRVELRVRHRDGRWVWLESLGSIRVDKGTQVAIVASRDITDRKRIELAQSGAEARIRNLVNNSPIILFEFDRDCIYTLSEGGGLAGVDRKPGEAVGESVDVVYKDVPAIPKITRMALAGETVVVEETVRKRWFRATAAPIYDESGVIVAAGGVAVDVTEMRAREWFLERQNSLLEMLALGFASSEVLAELACSLTAAIEGSACVLWVLEQGRMKPLFRCGLSSGAFKEAEEGVPVDEWALLWPAPDGEEETVSIDTAALGGEPALATVLAELGIAQVWSRRAPGTDGRLSGVITVNHFAKAEQPSSFEPYLGLAARVMRAALSGKESSEGVRNWPAAARTHQHGGETVPRPSLKRTRRGKAAQEALSLTDVQARMLRLISRGLSNDEIARAMGLSPHTIKEYVSVVSRSLGAKNRAHAVALAMQLGLV